MKEINKILLVILTVFCHTSYCQECEKPSWYSNTSFGLSVYHLGSFAKERPIFSLEQSFEIAPFEKIRFGIGTGINLYPATLTIPIFASAKYILKSKEKWSCSIMQSYGRNLKIGKIGFNSNRYIGTFGNSFQVAKKTWIQGELGYLLNWDRYGIGSISLILNLGINYRF